MSWEGKGYRSVEGRQKPLEERARLSREGSEIQHNATRRPAFMRVGGRGRSRQLHTGISKLCIRGLASWQAA